MASRLDRSNDNRQAIFKLCRLFPAASWHQLEERIVTIDIDRMRLIIELRSTVEQVMPGSIRYAPMVGDFGFAIRLRAGLAIVNTEPSDPWFLNITAGLAANVADLPRALAWVNFKNADHRFGRYYASVPAEGPERCNVVYQCNAFSGILELTPQFFQTSFLLLKLVTDLADNEGQQAVDSIGGTLFTDTSDMVMLLTAASLG